MKHNLVEAEAEGLSLHAKSVEVFELHHHQNLGTFVSARSASSYFV